MNRILPLFLVIFVATPLLGQDEQERKWIVKTSAMPVMNLFSSLAWADAGFEFTLKDNFRLDTDLGFYFRAPFNQNAEYSRGQFTNCALRYYLGRWELPYFIGLQYRFEHRKSVIEVDFSEAGYPYSKYIDADRHSNSLLLIAGSQRRLFFDWLMFEYYGGFGAEYRIGRLSGVTDYELEAIETGEVDAVKWDDSKGRIIPGWTVGMKLGVNLGELNWSKVFKNKK